MIHGLADRAVLLGLVASLAFGAGWKVNGWRLGKPNQGSWAELYAQALEAVR